MIDQSRFQQQTYGSNAAGRRPHPGTDAGSDERQRLNRTAQVEPRAVLGVVEFWLAAAGLEAGETRGTGSEQLAAN
jgi:hypothetical protein